MAANTRTKQERERDRVRISELYVRQWTQHRIAAEIGISQGLVSQEIKKIKKEWRESSVRNFDEERDKMLAEVNAIMEDARKGWEMSIGMQERITKDMVEGSQESEPTVADGQKAGTNRKSEKKSARVTRWNSSGAPKFLEIILKCLDRKAKLLGLDAPVTSEVKISSDISYEQAMEMIKELDEQEGTLRDERDDEDDDV